MYSTSTGIWEENAAKRYKYIADTRVYKRCKKSESIDEDIDEKVRGNISIEQILGKSTDKVTIQTEYWVRMTGSIEEAVESKAVLVLDGTNDSYLSEHCLSVRAKMEQRGNGGDQVMESNPPHQEASTGEYRYCLSLVPLVTILTYPKYVTCDPSKSEVINALLISDLRCYLSCMCDPSNTAFNIRLGINDLRCYLSCKSLDLVIKNCPLNKLYRCTDYHNIKPQHNGTSYCSICNARNMYMKPIAAQDICTCTYTVNPKSKSLISARPLYTEYVARNVYRYIKLIYAKGLYFPAKRLSKNISNLLKMPIDKIWSNTPYVVQLESNWLVCYRE
jgi:hypothetical protein